MKFRLTTTGMMGVTNLESLEKYLKKIHDSSLTKFDYIIEIEGEFVYIEVFYASVIVKLSEILGHELIITGGLENPTIEIYDDWRE